VVGDAAGSWLSIFEVLMVRLVEKVVIAGWYIFVTVIGDAQESHLACLGGCREQRSLIAKFDAVSVDGGSHLGDKGCILKKSRDQRRSSVQNC